MIAGARSVVVLLAVIGAGAFAVPACSSESDANYTCTPNVTKDGIQNVKNGCAEFAVCTDSSGHEQDPHECCKQLDNTTTEKECLYGYGVVEAGGAGGGGGSGS